MVSPKALRDFQVYARGVKRLEELEDELDSLDTKGFSKEEKDIRAKLKSVHLIPQIERELRELKAKISGIDLKYEKEQIDKKQSSKIRQLESKEGEIGKAAEKIPTIKHGIESLKSEVEKLRRAKMRKQLTGSEVKSVEKIPELKHAVASLHNILDEESAELKKIEPEIERALRAAYRKQLNKEEVKNVETIPSLRGKLVYLRELLERKTTELERVEGKVEKIPGLSRRVGALSRKSGEETEELEKVEEKIEKIPVLQRNISILSKILGLRSEEIAKEEGDIEKIKHRIDYLKRELEQKAKELESELKRKTAFPAKHRLIADMHELTGKMDQLKIDLNKKLVAESSESKWMIEREKQELREELSDIAAESRWIIEKEAQGINEQLLSEVAKLSQKFESDKNELYERLTSKIVQLKQQMDEMKKEKAKEERLNKEKFEWVGSECHEKFKETEKETPLLRNFGNVDKKRFAQPFLPPPEFSEVRIIKEEKNNTPSFREISFADVADLQRKFEKQKIKSFDANFDSDVPQLAPLPEINPAKAFASFNIPSFDKQKFEKKEKMPEVAEKPEVQSEAPETFVKELENSRTRLKKLPEESYTREIKSAVEMQKSDDFVKRTREIKESKNKLKAKASVFVELEDFEKSETEFGEIKRKAHELESLFKNSVSKKDSEQEQISELAEETEKIQQLLARINNNILSKIKLNENLK